MKKVFSIAILLTLLTVQADWRRSPELRIPQVAIPPVIDGVLNTGEYIQFASPGPLRNSVNGISGEVSGDVFWGFDREYFYAAFRFDREREQIDAAADYVEMAFNPGELMTVKFFPDGKCSLDGITYKARITPNGWEGEAALPLALLKLKADGSSRCGFDFSVTSSRPHLSHSHWSLPGRGQARYQRLGTIILDPSAPAVRVVHLGSYFEQGNPSAVITAINATGELELLQRKPGSAKSFYENIESGVNDVDQNDFDKNAELGAMIDFALKEYTQIGSWKYDKPVHGMAVSAQKGNGEYLLKYRLNSGDKILAAGVEVFELKPPLRLSAEPYWLYSEFVRMSADFAKIKMPDGGTMEFSSESSDGKQSYQLVKIPVPPQGGSINGQVPTDGLTPGFYRFKARLLDNKGNELAAEYAYLEKPERPEWYKNDFGKSIEVPDGWTPVKVNGTRVELWGRVIDLADGFPKSLISLQKEVLDRPVTFEINGKNLVVKSVKLKSSTPGHAIFELELTGSGLKLAGTAKVDFDGMIWYNLTLAPVGKAVRIENGKLTMPVVDAAAQLQLNHRLLNDPIFYPKGQSPKAARGGGSGKMVDSAIPFSPYVWVGSEKGGIGFIAEAPINWSVNAPNALFEIRKRGENQSPINGIVANIFQQPFELKEPLALEFGIQGTPIRPEPEDHAILNIYQKNGPFVDEKVYQQLKEGGCRVVVYYYGWRGDSNSEMGGTPEHSKDPKLRQLLKDAVKMAHSYGLKVLLFTGWGVNANSPIWPKFGYELGRYPIENNGWGTYAQSAGFNGAYIDFMAAGHAMLAREYEVDGVLWDSTANLVQDCNLPIGTAWVDSEGRTRPKFSVLATRELFKRIYNIYKGEIRSGGIIYNHAGSMWPINAYSDMLNRGEGRPMKAPTLKDSWAGTEEFRAGYSGTPFGVLFTGENNDFSNFPMRVSTHLAMFLLHANYPKEWSTYGIGKKPTYEYKRRPIYGLWQIFAWLPFDKDTKRYYYYDHPGYVELKGDDLLSSAFVGKDAARAVIVISNFAKAERKNVEAVFNFDKLQLKKGEISLTDAYSGEKIILDNHTIKIDIEPERYRILKLEVK